MREWLTRLRAMMTPQMLVLIASLAIMTGTMLSTLRGYRQGTELERRIAHVLSAVEGAGSVQVVIRTRAVRTGNTLSSVEQEICGAAAVAQGADDPVICMELTQLLCALLGLPASAVSVVTGGG